MLSSIQSSRRAMTAEQFLALAETLRTFAHHSERDTNAANLFVHTMLMRAIRNEAAAPDQPPADERQAAA